MSDSKLVIHSRDQLAAALRFASIVEHMLLCEYLYAGFSVRRTLSDFDAESVIHPVGRARAQAQIDLVRPWLAQVYTIARQEMEHLGIVQNLLVAIGEGPYFMRPDFPVSSHHTLLGAPFRLDRFDVGTLRRFIWYERPDYLTAQFHRHHGDPSETDLADLDPAFVPTFLHQATSVQALYEAIGAAFQTLDPADLFRADPGRQLPETTFGYRIQMMSITNRASAAAAVQLILEQGEGISEPTTSGEPAHFERFLAVLRGLEAARAVDPEFDPALRLVSNPVHRDAPQGLCGVREDKVTRITNPHTRQVMALFDDTYSLMLQVLQRFFEVYSSIASPEPRPQTALFYAGFFPLMTMAVRPLAEILVRMPAHGDGVECRPGEGRAGPAFSVDPGVVGWVDQGGQRYPVIRSADGSDYYRDQLSGLAKRVVGLVDSVPASQRENLRYLHQNLVSTSAHLESIWKQGQ